MSNINPKKLKVVELKAELESRSITVSKGLKKADLIALLVSAIESKNTLVFVTILSSFRYLYRTVALMLNNNVNMCR